MSVHNIPRYLWNNTNGTTVVFHDNMKSNSSVAEASAVTTGQRLNFNIHLLSVTPRTVTRSSWTLAMRASETEAAGVGRVSALMIMGVKMLAYKQCLFG